MSTESEKANGLFYTAPSRRADRVEGLSPWGLNETSSPDRRTVRTRRSLFPRTDCPGRAARSAENSISSS